MKLATRMLLIGAAQLALLGAAAITILAAFAQGRDVYPDELVEPAKLEALAGEPQLLHAALQQLSEERVSVSIYNEQRQLIDSNVDPALAPPPPRPPHPPFGGPRPPGHRPHLPHGPMPMIAPFHVGTDHGVLIARGERARPPGWTGPILILVFAVSVLLVGPLLTARWLVRPMERLSRTASAFGNGDLDARSRLRRTDEIGDLGRRFDEMADRIEALIRSEKELFANVAHELRTPLARIGVALDLAGAGDAAAARESLAEIAVDLTELETILDDVLSTMRFEIARDSAGAAQVPLRCVHVTPASVVDAAVNRQQARNPSRCIAVNVAEDLPSIDVDPMLVRRALENLLENSHKYTPDPKATTHLRVRRDGDRVVFEVTDRGLGIAAEDLPRVFTAFFRSDRSRSRETGGVGLGLTLARRIVEAHGGTIEVTSQLGTGTTMRVTLPAALPNVS